MKDKFVFYIHSDIFNENNFEDEKIDVYLKTIFPLLDVARFLQATVYYSYKDIEKLKESLNLDEYFTQSQANKLDVLLEKFKPSKEISHLFKVHFAETNTSFEPYNFDIHHSESNQIAILFNLNKEEELYLLKVKSNNDFKQIKMQSVFKKEALWTIINKQIERKYNFSSKHGDSTTSAIPPKANEKVSQLLTSQNETQLLLDNAIFDYRENQWCYNFDFNKGTYIIFPYEGVTPQNQYHAFHIQKNEWEKEIPKSIRKYFKQ